MEVDSKPSLPRCCFLSCGEASGDVYAASIARELKKCHPSLRLVGVGGEHLRGEDVEIWADLEQLSVMGFGEVLRHLPRLKRLRDDLCRRALEEGVDLFLPVDYPGFHGSLAGQLRRRGVPALHFIPPKTWSWGPWRLRALRKSADRCAVIFPFEEAYYRSHGIAADFVGHPLPDLHEVQLAEHPEREGLLLVPGSRPQELRRIGAALGELARLLEGVEAASPLRVSLADGLDRRELDPILDRFPAAEIVSGKLLPWLQRAKAAIVTSGTATMEAALARTPHVIVYRTGNFTYFLARMLARVEHVGMANIILDRRVVPELIQGDMTAENIAAELIPLLEGKPQALRQKEAFGELASLLGGRGAFQRVAKMAIGMINERR